MAGEQIIYQSIYQCSDILLFLSCLPALLCSVSHYNTKINLKTMNIIIKYQIDKTWRCFSAVQATHFPLQTSYKYLSQFNTSGEEPVHVTVPGWCLFSLFGLHSDIWPNKYIFEQTELRSSCAVQTICLTLIIYPLSFLQGERVFFGYTATL